jgi:poly(hydroxyalkanoate) depolymerase family esterase
MTNEILARLARATELTRSGRLAEATELIQSGFAGTGSASFNPFNPAAPMRDDALHDVIEGEFVERGAVDTQSETDKTARPTPRFGGSAAGRHGFQDPLRKWRTPGAPAPDAAAPAEPAQPGQFITGVHANAAGERSYKLYIPSRYTGQPLPLIVMLHGCKQTPDDFAAGTQMNRLGEERDCFILYPEQSGAANHSRCWNWFRREDQVRDRGEPSILAEMTGAVVDRYKIDAGKVYVAGLSAGGAMAAVMGVTYPDVYAAVGIHSGLACGSAHDLPSALAAMKGMPAGPLAAPASARPHAVPTIVFHGDRDRTVHPRNGQDAIAQSTHHADGARATSERGQAPGGHSYTRTIHRDTAGRVVLEHWLVHGGGHAWFGGSRAGSYSDPRGPSAAAEMLRFFLQPD